MLLPYENANIIGVLTQNIGINKVIMKDAKVNDHIWQLAELKQLCGQTHITKHMSKYIIV